ncbi:tail fiber protein [Bifidobacterium phage PMBT6]|nr:tail fiber protein [Bifidobacterium phage PMBT6]QDF14890.1 tail fiber protein [Bifidobacterium phage PMBT6]
MAWTATGGNLKGPKGDPGTNGAKGDAGTSLHVANIDISSNSDVATSSLSPSAPMTVGDLISDNNGDLFTVTSIVNETTVHVSNVISGVSFKGPQGERGADGAPGKDGTGVTILGSADSPEALKAAHSTGKAGDAYLIGGHLYVWDMVGAGWKDVGTIQGPKGDKGDPGTNGKDGKDGKDGLGWTYGHGVPSSTGQPVGSLYLDLDTGNVYAFNA